MKGAGVTPNAVTYGVLLRSCERRGLWEEALGHFEEMKAASIEPNIVVFNSLLASYEGDAQFERAEALYQSMRVMAEGGGLELNATTFVIRITACANRNKWEEVIQLLYYKSWYYRGAQIVFSC
jgi:pentatricopeptide repeat protein